MDVNRLRVIAEGLEARYQAVDETFRALPTEVMRYRFLGVKKLEDDPSHFEFLSNRRRNSLVGMEALDSETQIRRQAFHFQWLARQYVATFAQLKAAMLEICERVQKDMAEAGAMSAPTLADINDAGLSPDAFLLFVRLSERMGVWLTGVWICSCLACHRRLGLGHFAAQ
ncbi:unnamed protein product [Phytophthora fragariaefolia]|uniref:Unnamed protein product n=1 Tax=Phytophthora fragariaefolia TaxID=1490495 RepID=A0A9W7CTI6_9STRA|nr:unnamed protein product [Phytophthora fragariaefolia]